MSVESLKKLLDRAEKMLVESYAEVERLKSKNRWAELDIAELIDDFGVHPLYWNGVHQACLNGGNVPVKFFKTKYQCKNWCDSKNKDATETPTIEIAELKEKIAKLTKELGDWRVGMQGLRGGSLKHDDMIGPGSHELKIPTGLECPSCGEQIKIGGTHYCKNYCPTCGSDMGSDKEFPTIRGHMWTCRWWRDHVCDCQGLSEDKVTP